jgi:flagellar protein FlbT
MHISLRANEKIYINGAVLRVDRKTSIELMNDAAFLLESHVMMAKDATTPLRQLYFIVQLLLIDPIDTTEPLKMFGNSITAMLKAYEDLTILKGLRTVRYLVEKQRYFEALKTIRGLYPIEQTILAPAVKPVEAA